MGRYAIIKGDLVDGIAVADDPLETDGMWICVDGMSPEPAARWKYENGVFSPPPVSPPAPPSYVITKIAFRFRFTDPEYSAILGAAKTDTEVQAWYETFNMVSTIDLDSQRVKDGIANLVGKNLLTQARATEILTAPIQPGERP